MRSLPFVVLMIALAAAAAACLDGSLTAPNGDREGLIRFDYHGDPGVARFQARGEAKFTLPSGSPQHGIWAAALYYPEDTTVSVLGFRGRDEPKGSAVLLHLGIAETIGPLELGPAGCTPGEAGGECRILLFSPDLDIDALADFRLERTGEGDVYEVREGTVEITAIDSGRIRGTFSGSGSVAGSPERAFHISEGLFNVPIFRY